MASQRKQAEKDLAVANMFFNFIAPYYDSARVGGTLTNAGVGALNEWVVRWFLKRRVPIIQLGMAHVLAEPFMGVTGYFPTGDPNTAKFMENVTSGARQGVAVLFGHWLMNVLQNGFKIGIPSFMFVLIVIGSKSLGRSEIAFMLEYMPTAMKKQYDAYNDQLQKGELWTNLKMDAKKEGV
jgi:hypothetical protein